MTAPLFAGFEGALLPWNGHDTLLQTQHTPEADMARHYADAIAQGAVGFPTICDRWEWLDHVSNEIEASGVPLVCSCYAPWLSMSWEGGNPWPNGFPALESAKPDALATQSGS